jgi:hypothetical protein
MKLKKQFFPNANEKVLPEKRFKFVLKKECKNNLKMKILRKSGGF